MFRWLVWILLRIDFDMWCVSCVDNCGWCLISNFRKVLSWMNFGFRIVLMVNVLDMIFLFDCKLVVCCCKVWILDRMCLVSGNKVLFLVVRIMLDVFWLNNLMLRFFCKVLICKFIVGWVRCSFLVVWVRLFLWVIVINVCNWVRFIVFFCNWFFLFMNLDVDKFVDIFVIRLWGFCG